MPARYRESGGFIPQPPIQIFNRPDPASSWVAGATLNSIQTGIQTTCADVSVPSYHKRVAKGEVFFNPWTRTSWSSSSSGGNGYHMQLLAAPHRETKVEGDWLGYTVCKGGILSANAWLFTNDEYVDLLNEVSTEVRANRGMPDNNLAESLAEADQTLQMLTAFNRGVDRLLGPYMNKRGLIALPANAYLAFRYGLTPLLRDIESVTKGLSARTGRVRRTTRASREIVRSNTTTYETPNKESVITTYQRVRHHTLSVRGMSLDELTASTLSNIGFSVKGLLVLPLELTPYSFVADWFFNTGNAIRSWVPAIGYNQLGSCASIRDDRIDTWQVLNTRAGSAWSVIRPCSGVLTCQNLTLRRQGLGDTSIGVRNSFGFDRVTRIADAFALTGQIILRIFAPR